MTDLDKRLRADGQAWRAAVGTQLPVTLTPTVPAWRRWLVPAAVAAALVAATAGVFGLAHVPRAHRSSPPAAAAQPQLGCSIRGLAAEEAPSGTTGLHSVAQAEAVAGIPATAQPKFYLAMVTDPTAPKLNIGPPDVARLMWVFTAQSTDADPNLDGRLVGHGPYNPYPAGTIFNYIWLVDDLTLARAGNFACLASGSSSPTSP
jgi:hypothetical protein